MRHFYCFFFRSIGPQGLGLLVAWPGPMHQPCPVDHQVHHELQHLQQHEQAQAGVDGECAPQGSDVGVALKRKRHRQDCAGILGSRVSIWGTSIMDFFGQAWETCRKVCELYEKVAHFMYLIFWSVFHRHSVQGPEVHVELQQVILEPFIGRIINLFEPVLGDGQFLNRLMLLLLLFHVESFQEIFSNEWIRHALLYIYTHIYINNFLKTFNVDIII